MSDVKRFNMVVTDHDGISASMDEAASGEYVLASDHERIVAERNAQIHQRDNVIEMYRNSIAELELNESKMNGALSSKQEIIDSQNLEIAKLKEQLKSRTVLSETFEILKKRDGEIAELKAKLNTWSQEELDMAKVRGMELRSQLEIDKQEIAELKSRLEHSETKVQWLLRDNEKNLATANAKIAKLREQRDDAVYDSFYETGYGQTPGAVQKIEKLDAELAALEGEK